MNCGPVDIKVTSKRFISLDLVLFVCIISRVIDEHIHVHVMRRLYLCPIVKCDYRLFESVTTKTCD